MNKILVIDNYDSFTYNLVHLIKEITSDPVDVVRNDKITLPEIEKYNKIVISPGPGIPDEAGITKSVIKEYAKTKSILGVCLGHQSIAEVFGGTLYNLPTVYHGVETSIVITKKDEILFKSVPENIMGGRYHSWIVAKEDLPVCFDITAEDEEGVIMAISHKKYDVKGVQFHPESVLTPEGKTIMTNWLSN